MSLEDDILRNFGGLDQCNLSNIVRQHERDDIDNLMPSSIFVDSNNIDSFLSPFRNKFSILSLNIQSLNAKFDNLRHLIHDISCLHHDFSVICLQETWIHEHNSNFINFTLPHYNMMLLKASISTHSGLCTYVHDTFSSNVRHFEFSSNEWEGQFIDLTHPSLKHKITICNIYRPPRENIEQVELFLKEITPILHQLSRENSEVVFTGDFNLDLLMVNQKSIISKYLDLMFTYNFIPTITLPTRIHSSATLIDNIFHKSSKHTNLSGSGILLNNLSDHLPTILCIDMLVLPNKHPKFIKSFTFNETALNNFITDVQNTDFLSNFDVNLTTDPNINFNIFADTLNTLKEKHFPVKVSKFNKKKHGLSPWITPGIIKSINFRNKIYKDLLSEPRNSATYNEIKTNLRTYNSILKKSIRRAKANYYENQFEQNKNDIKRTWGIINQILKPKGDKRDYPSSFKINDNMIITDKQSIANNFNSFFATIGSKLDPLPSPTHPNSYKHFLNKKTHTRFSFHTITANQVEKIISKFVPKSSSGPDDISAKIVKSIKTHISTPLSLIINQSFVTGIFPNRLKLAKVLPIYKKDDDQIFTNYRPISLLSVFSKVFEKIAYSQFYEYLMRNNLIYGSQHGFRTQHSTETAAYEFHDVINTYLDNNFLPLSVHLDLSKAFDTLNHSILIDKLNYYGVVDTSLNWFSSYLSERNQYCIFEDHSSDILPLNMGVPQGSVLGPLLFLIYINDINCASILFHTILYADDSTLIYPLNRSSMADDIHILNSELSKVFNWLILNKLYLNTNKTKYMIFHYPQKKIDYDLLPPVVIGGKPISRTGTFNFLGILFQDTLSWKAHVTFIGKKIARGIGGIRKMQNIFPPHVLKMLYNSLILPHINFGILAWGLNSSHIFLLQKKAIRSVFRAKYNAHTEPLFKIAFGLKLNDIYILKALKFFFKYDKGHVPSFFKNNIFAPRTHTGTYPTRLSLIPQPQLARHQTSSETLRFIMPKIIKDTPSCIMDKLATHSYEGFSLYIKKHLINKYSMICLIPNCYVCSNNSNT